MEPLVSVIVPVYNVVPYLQEALDSLLRQTYRNLEILIIDDGSNDGSERICDEYQRRDLRVRVFHQENRGLSAARNVGLEHMRGEVVVFLDPDDVMYPNMIETVLRTMTEKQVRMVAFGTVLYHNGKTVSSPADGYYDRMEALKSYLTKGGLAGAIWTKSFEAELFENIRFKEGHNYADVAVFFRILEKCKTFYAFHEPLFKYRKRPCSITSTNSPENCIDALEQKLWVTEYASSLNTNGSINDLLIKLEIDNLKTMLVGFNALFFDHSKQSESVKQLFKLEIAKRTGKISYSQFLVKIATNVFLFSPILFIYLYKIKSLLK